MNHCSGIYPENLEKLILENNLYIPRQIRSKEKLKIYHRYWNIEIGEFKVKSVESIENCEYYFVNLYGTERQAVLTYPISPGAYCYELLKNYDHIESISIINNRSRTFTGAEIRFWFIKNKINFDNENYSPFLDDLLYDSGIKDSTKYQVRRNKKQNIYEFIEKYSG